MPDARNRPTGNSGTSLYTILTSEHRSKVSLPTGNLFLTSCRTDNRRTSCFKQRGKQTGLRKSCSMNDSTDVSTTTRESYNLLLTQESCGWVLLNKPIFPIVLW